MQFKSATFGTQGITLHRYYKIGVGVEVIIEKTGVFRSSIETESPYTGTTRENGENPKSEKRRRSLRGYLNLQCCSLCENWYQDAESLSEYLSIHQFTLFLIYDVYKFYFYFSIEEHMAVEHFDGNDEPQKRKYGEDKIKSNFGRKLKFSAAIEQQHTRFNNPCRK